MHDARAPSSDVAWAWGALERSHGKAPIGWICDRLGRSRRHLAVQFRDQVGLPPKIVARILRFDRAVSMLARPHANLVDVAFECGYYDQAHLSRDFRSFAGKPPAAFARQIVPDGGVIV
jgi:AraC-like DNA-binding protein